MINEFLNLKGFLEITLQKSNGETFTTTVPNLIVTTGKIYVAERVLTGVFAPISHMAVGTNNTAPAVGNSILNTELSRVALTQSSRTDNALTFNATFGPGVGTGVLVEAGLFNANSAGTMLCRTIFPSITKNADDILTINWSVVVV